MTQETEIKDYSFHGVSMTQVEFAVALAKKNDGICPFCNAPLSHAFSNANKHLRFCGHKNQTARLTFEALTR